VYLTNRHSRILAKRSGAFRRPKLALTFLGQTVSIDNPPLAWCFRHPGQESEAAIYRLPFVLRNTGDARCDDVVVTLLGPAECFGDPKGSYQTVVPGVFKGALKRSLNDLGKLRLVAYKLDKIGATSAVSISDLIILRPSTNVPHTVHATTKDDVAIEVNMRFTFVYMLRWAVATPDQRVMNLTTPIYCIAAAQGDAISREFLGMLSEKIQSYLQDAGRWERVLYRLLRVGVSRQVVFADFGVPKTVSVKGQRVHRLDDTANECVVRVLDCTIPRFMDW
jgi:hypothetical protein